MTDPKLSPQPNNAALGQALNALNAHWAWFVVLGIIMLILGAAAAVYVLTATLVSVLIVGVLMLIGGIGQLIHAWRVKGLRGFIFWTASGVLYTLAGLLAIINPVVGAAMLTLLLGASLIAAGALRLWMWFNYRSQRGWQWIALSGVITLAAGILIAAGWPGNSLWIIGLLLAFDLFIQGWTLLFLGFSLHRRQQ